MTALSIDVVAPGFSLMGLDAQSHTLYKDGARMTLVVFFKTTCPTCRVAWQYIEKLHRSYQGAGLAVWGVSQHDKNRSSDFAIEYKSTFPILIDDDWRVSKQYDPDYVPTLFLIDATGKIVDQVVAFDKAGLNRLSQAIAARLNVSTQVIAPDNDGNPPFKPG